jgi:hypothetical protein
MGTPRSEYTCDVASVGSNGVGYHDAVWPYRKELLQQLRVMCLRNGWSFRNPGGDDPKIDRGEDMNDFYTSAKVTVGDSLCLDREKTLYCSDRAYEGPGRGGLLIMPQLDFLDEDYAGHLPMYRWAHWDDLERKIRHYFTNEADNQAVREETQAIVRDGHTYKHRVQELLRQVGPDMNERLIKCAVMLVLAPFLALAMVGLACVMLFLPIVALISPKLIKFREDINL